MASSSQINRNEIYECQMHKMYYAQLIFFTYTAEILLVQFDGTFMHLIGQMGQTFSKGNEWGEVEDETLFRHCQACIWT